jgi:hypothetical protein
MTGILDVGIGYLLGLAISKSIVLKTFLDPSQKRMKLVEAYLTKFDGKIGSKNFLR